MGLYTIFENAEVDACIDAHISYITNAILNTISDPVAIILTGGFGRGEGSVINTDGTCKPLNDYDFLVVVPDSDHKISLKDLSIKLALDIGIDFVDIGFLTYQEIVSLPLTMFYYDLKYGSRVVWGNEDMLLKIPNFDREKISLWEGQKLLFNRFAGILGGFTLDRYLRQLAPQETNYLNNQVMKALLACGDALLLSQKAYHHSYSTRRKTLGEVYRRNDLPFLSEDDYNTIDSAYREKLAPQASSVINVHARLLNAMPLLEKVFLEISSVNLEHRCQNLGEFIKIYSTCRKTPSRESVLGVLRFVLKNMGIYTQVRETRFLALNDKAYITLPLILFSMRNFRSSIKILKISEAILHDDYNKDKMIKKNNYDDKWESLRKAAFGLWERKCH